MKHLVKWMLGFAVVFLFVGLGFAIAGVSLGAGFSDAEFLNEMGYRVLHIRDFSKVDSVIKGEEELGNILEESKTEEIQYEEYEGRLKTEHETHDGDSIYELVPVKNLEIDLKAGELSMLAYDGAEIQIKVDHENTDSVKVSTGENFLKIEGLQTIHSGDVEVYYPQNLNIEQLKIEVDAGTVIMKDDIYADLLDISIGAGELDAKGKVFTKSSVIEVGAGAVNMEWISASSLEGSCGIGEMSLGMEGKEKDYNYDLECGLGAILIGDNMHSSIVDHQKIENGRSQKNISLSCGMGQIGLIFV